MRHATHDRAEADGQEAFPLPAVRWTIDGGEAESGEDDAHIVLRG